MEYGSPNSYVVYVQLETFCRSSCLAHTETNGIKVVVVVQVVEQWIVLRFESWSRIRLFRFRVAVNCRRRAFIIIFHRSKIYQL